MAVRLPPSVRRLFRASTCSTARTVVRAGVDCLRCSAARRVLKPTTRKSRNLDGAAARQVDSSCHSGQAVAERAVLGDCADRPIGTLDSWTISACASAQIASFGLPAVLEHRSRAARQGPDPGVRAHRPPWYLRTADVLSSAGGPRTMSACNESRDASCAGGPGWLGGAGGGAAGPLG
jgi:hypothetical protein